MEYSRLRANLFTGDIVLFSGKGTISNCIKFFTKSRWSHVGMILKIPEYDYVALWESTTLSNVKDVHSRTYRKGVQLVPLSERLDKYQGEIAVRRLKHDGGKWLPKDSIVKLMKLRRKLQGRDYERNKLELLNSVIDASRFTENQEDLSSIFCSELVAEAYQSLDLLNDLRASNEYVPADFSQKGIRELKHDFYLSDEIMVEMG